MTLDLILGDPTYSSWSMRVGLLADRFDLPVRTTFVTLYSPGFDRFAQDAAPVRTVPALRLEDGTMVGESLAIVEELATRFPEARLWPADPSARAAARMLAAEMHAGFHALRGECPMNLRRAYVPAPPGDAVCADLARIETLWTWARARFGGAGPWLCGPYCAADAFFAPVAARIAGYGLPVGPVGAAYVAAHLAEASFVRWRDRALAEGPGQPVYTLDRPTRPWPRAASDLNRS